MGCLVENRAPEFLWEKTIHPGAGADCGALSRGGVLVMTLDKEVMNRCAGWKFDLLFRCRWMAPRLKPMKVKSQKAMEKAEKEP
ncbi:hypothetical protein CEXT_269921 [Caerostris extrusa]|uniref:Uncharacterized protein n=1 Tax=Caerostris extrusa TaxID=172846 RepID=A0AAV4P393_CAEEX|nr:hypothetical protein CEXT_269921 [Caerostris extrusa]